MTEDKEEIKETAEPKVEEAKKEYKSVEVANSYVPAIQTPEGGVITDSQALVMLLNEVKRLTDNLL